ncbi:Zinc finger BED domain-containing protein 5 [Eumeta japonica]|uniref:Zinc finger BED domain-containing protein 5 n=1 Tax=Eumeta variegata TaxID=151549 RepID=A0A4C1V255_EUMVA|nr:Zinc finger BED domain-containing protein 5 [Eumeta japonica]
MERWLKGVKRVATSSNDAECSKAVRAENTAITDPDDDVTTSSSRILKTKKRNSMAPAKLLRHLETVHPESKDMNKDFFVRKKEQLLESQKNIMRATQAINEKATEASCLVSYRIAKAGEVHTIAENLIKSCVLDITKCMLDEKSAKHLSTVPLSNDTVSRRIHDLTSYVKQELVERLQKTRFALQMDKSTDVVGLPILLVIARYPYESSFEEDMLMCSPLPTNTIGEEMFNKINIFFEENNLKWDHCIDICTDGVKAMTGKQTTVFQAYNKITAFKRKLDFWIICVGKREIESFTSLSEFVSDNDSEMFQDDVFEELVQYLTSIRASLEKYFPEEQNTKMKHYSWIHNPFAPNLQKPKSMSNEIYESLLEMSSDTSMESLFKTMPPNDFWCRIRDEYPMFGKMTLNILLPFPTTYLCETGFSTYAATKTKCSNRLDAEPDMRLQLSSIKPDIYQLMKNKKQFHTSN